MRPPETGEARAARFAGGLVLLAGAVHGAIGLAAIAGNETLRDYVLEIEANKDFGNLYFSLETWGIILLVIGVGEFIAAIRLLRARPNARLVALLMASVALAGAFASLAIFRWAVLATIPVLLLAIFVLSRLEQS